MPTKRPSASRRKKAKTVSEQVKYLRELWEKKQRTLFCKPRDLADLVKAVQREVVVRAGKIIIPFEVDVDAIENISDFLFEGLVPFKR